MGDIVSIEYAGRKLSARKSFILTEILFKAKKFVHPITGQIYTMPGAHLPLRDRMNLKLPKLDKTVMNKLKQDLKLL